MESNFLFAIAGRTVIYRGVALYGEVCWGHCWYSLLMSSDWLSFGLPS
ncbi:MAG: hypothetical protein WA949_14620 [Phormidesmis sp.]